MTCCQKLTVLNIVNAVIVTIILICLVSADIREVKKEDVPGSYWLVLIILLFIIVWIVAVCNIWCKPPNHKKLYLAYYMIAIAMCGASFIVGLCKYEICTWGGINGRPPRPNSGISSTCYIGCDCHALYPTYVKVKDAYGIESDKYTWLSTNENHKSPTTINAQVVSGWFLSFVSMILYMVSTGLLI